jgi:hypothetical protein
MLGVVLEILEDSWEANMNRTLRNQKRVIAWLASVTCVVLMAVTVVRAAGGLASGQTLNPNESVWAGGYQLTYQSDGNLVLSSGGTPLWNSGTHNTSPGFVAMQSDGNLVVYDSGSNPVWWSGTGEHPGAILDIENGDMAIRRPSEYSYWSQRGGYPVWWSSFFTQYMPDKCHDAVEIWRHAGSTPGMGWERCNAAVSYIIWSKQGSCSGSHPYYNAMLADYYSCG